MTPYWISGVQADGQGAGGEADDEAVGGGYAAGCLVVYRDCGFEGSGSRIPDSGGAVMACGREKSATIDEDGAESGDATVVAVQSNHLAACSRIPDEDDLVVASGCDESVTANCDGGRGVYVSMVSVEDDEWLAGIEVPDADGAVVACGCDPGFSW